MSGIKQTPGLKLTSFQIEQDVKKRLVYMAWSKVRTPGVLPSHVIVTFKTMLMFGIAIYYSITMISPKKSP